MSAVLEAEERENWLECSGLLYPPLTLLVGSVQPSLPSRSPRSSRSRRLCTSSSQGECRLEGQGLAAPPTGPPPNSVKPSTLGGLLLLKAADMCSEGICVFLSEKAS